MKSGLSECVKNCENRKVCVVLPNPLPEIILRNTDLKTIRFLTGQTITTNHITAFDEK